MIKCFRDRPGVRAARPQRREDDGAVHEGLRGAAREDLPRARRVRDGRHGGADPVAQGRGGQRARRSPAVREATRSARPRPASTAPGSRTRTSSTAAEGSSTTVLGDKPNQIDKQRPDVSVTARAAARRRRPRPARSPRRACAATSRRLPVHLVLARRPRRGGDQQPDGGRRHGRDLPLADLAVDPPRQVHPRARRARCSTRRWRGSATRSATRSGRRAAPTRRREIFERVALGDEFPEFLTLPAYEYLD